MRLLHWTGGSSGHCQYAIELNKRNGSELTAIAIPIVNPATEEVVLPTNGAVELERSTASVEVEVEVEIEEEGTTIGLAEHPE